MAQATKPKPNDVRHHLAALNHAWALFGLLENRWAEPTNGPDYSTLLSDLDSVYRQNIKWLEENGIAVRFDGDALTWVINGDILAPAAST